MKWEIRQTNRFARAYKKLNDSTAEAVDSAVETISKNPEIGEKKKGDLAKLRVYKFKHSQQLYLLGYTCEHEIKIIMLQAIGSHQNFYRDMKK